jgi:uncharacterized repeat protein (TIGR01451 family)
MITPRLVAGLAIITLLVTGPGRSWAQDESPVPPPPPLDTKEHVAQLPPSLPPPPPTSQRSASPTSSPQTTTRAAASQPVAAPGRQVPTVSLEWSGPPALRVGQPATFQIVVRNAGVVPVYQVVVRHRLPEGMTSSVSGTMPVTKDGQMSWALGTLRPGQERRIDVQMVPAARTDLDLQATVTFSGAASLHVVVHEPHLVLKVTAPQRVMLGDNATVNVTVGNTGDGPAEHVKVQATLPEGLEHPRGRQIDVDLGTLGPQEQRTLQLICTARGTGGQPFEAVAIADGNLKVDGAAAVEVLLPRIDLALSGPHLRYQGRHAVYTLKAINPGSAPTTNVSLQAVVPPGLKFRAASGSGKYDPAAGAVFWFVGDLAPGQSREVSLDLEAARSGQFLVKATALASRGLKAQAEVRTRVEGLSALQLDVADADDPVEVGTDTAYEVRVTNRGSKLETNLELTCTLPPQMELRGAKCTAGCHYRVEGREVIFDAVPRLASKADVVYRLNVRGTVPGDVHFRASVRADGMTEPLQREESTKIYSDDAGSH